MFFKNSNKRYKEYKRFEHIEFIEPFSKKKNIKFLKRNRFVNFVFEYVLSMKKLQWGQRNEISKVQVLKRQLSHLISYRLLYWMQRKSNKVRILQLVRSKLQNYFKLKLKALKSYYKDTIMGKELYFQENFPQEMLSPHRKRRIFTYIKRLVQPHSRSNLSYSKFKMDLLYIMTSRTKKKEFPLSFIQQIPNNSFMKNYYNIPFYAITRHTNNRSSLGFMTIPEKYKLLEQNLSFLLFKLNLFNTVAQSLQFIEHNNIKLNCIPTNKDVMTFPGDLIEFEKLNILYLNKINTSFILLFLFLNSYRQKKHIYLRSILLRKLYILVYKICLIHKNYSQIYSYQLKPNFNLTSNVYKSFIFYTLVKSTFNDSLFISWSNSHKRFIIHNQTGISLPQSNLINTTKSNSNYIINKNYTSSTQVLIHT